MGPISRSTRRRPGGTRLSTKRRLQMIYGARLADAYLLQPAASGRVCTPARYKWRLKRGRQGEKSTRSRAPGSADGKETLMRARSMEETEEPRMRRVKGEMVGQA